MHKCKECKKVFKTVVEFEAHPCVTQLQKLSLEELLAQYNAEKGKGK